METISFLIADDTPLFRAVLRQIIHGHPSWQLVAEAVDGSQALALALQHRPDVILMDADMPQMNGFDATRRIKRMLQLTRIIIFSGHRDEELLQACARAGGDYYLEKEHLDDCLLTRLVAGLLHKEGLRND